MPTPSKQRFTAWNPDLTFPMAGKLVKIFLGDPEYKFLKHSGISYLMVGKGAELNTPLLPFLSQCQLPGLIISINEMEPIQEEGNQPDSLRV